MIPLRRPWPPIRPMLLVLLVAGAVGSNTAAQTSTPVIKHKFDGKAAGGSLGWSVAGVGDLDADGKPDVAIGAPAHPTGSGAVGATYLHSGKTGRLLLTILGSDEFDTCGHSVDGAGDIDGDGRPDIVIGSPYTDIPGAGSTGAVAVFSGKTGALLLRWEGPPTTTLSGFGESVAGAGDVDGDGRPDVVVGASLFTPGAVYEAGAAYVYSGATGALVFEIDGQELLGDLGCAVAGAGDADGDGHADVIVGELQIGTSGGGRVSVISGATQAVLLQIEGQYPAFYGVGHAVASAGDIDGDGRPDLIVGAPYSNVGSKHWAGRVNVYSVTTASLLLSITGQQAEGVLGESVDGAGDVDGDGTPDLVIGSPLASPDGKHEAGRAGVYSGKTGQLLFSYTGKRAGDHFGQSVAGVGDIDGDGRAEVIVGAPDMDYMGEDTGSAFVIGLQ
jgi:hypothetical protein